MRIAHIATFVSEDGAFGGPIAVAAGHAEELARRGHDVDFLAGWDGKAELAIPGVNVRLFPVRRLAPGLSGLMSPSLLGYLRDASTTYDIVHVHMGRDLITLPAALAELARGRRVYLQTHGMVMPDRRIHALAFDAAFTRRALKSASVVFVLTEEEDKGIHRVAPRSLVRTVRIANGVAVGEVEQTRRPDPPVVLFLARLHPRKRVLVYAEAARILHDRGVDAIFRVIGPDEGDLRALLAYKAEHALDQLEYGGAIPAGSSGPELARATVYVLPSHGEVFPMTVLESFAAGTPVVLSTDCAIAPELAQRGAIEPTEGDSTDLARAISVLLDDERLREIRVSAAREALTGWLAIGAVVDRLEEAYT